MTNHQIEDISRGRPVEKIPGGFLIIEDGHFCPYNGAVYEMFAILSDGSNEFLGVTVDRPNAEYTVLRGSKRDPIPGKS